MTHFENHWLTKGQINFTRQDINRQLALESSISRKYATIDLKDASDRVSCYLVDRIFSQVPDLLFRLRGCRTTATKLPDGRVVALKKFAPMGSALCFPIEAAVFWVIIVAAICRGLKLPLALVGKEVFVYGDDIIVPTDWAPLSMQALERFSLRVNHSKCCIGGLFRESCGIDAFKGVVVTPQRIRTQWTDHPCDGSVYASYISLANELCKAGYTSCSDLVWDKLRRTYGALPYGTTRSSFPCRIVDFHRSAESLNKDLFRSRFNRDYQCLEFLLPVVKTRSENSQLDGWPRLLRDVCQGLGDEPSRVLIPRHTKIRRRWTRV
jgi:hypothetical protein